MLFYALLGCTTSSDLSYSTATTASQEVCEAAAPGTYARNAVDKIIGVKVFTMEKDLQSFQSAEEIVAAGINTVSISYAIPFDEQGNLRYPFNPYGEKYSSIEDTTCRIGNLVHEMKSAGLSVYLSGEPHYYNPTEGEEPPRLTEFEDPTVISNFQTQVAPVFDSIAELAETYKVEYVAPLSEPDKYLGTEAANTLMQNAKNSFSSYQGKLSWQVYGEAFYELNMEPYRFDFNGYDTLGYAILGCEQPRHEWDNYMSTLWGWAQEDNVSEAVFAEFGCTQQPNNQQEAAANLQYWYEQAASYSKGVIVVDNPRSIPNAQTVKDTWLHEWLSGFSN